MMSVMWVRQTPQNDLSKSFLSIPVFNNLLFLIPYCEVVYPMTLSLKEIHTEIQHSDQYTIPTSTHMHMHA